MSLPPSVIYVLPLPFYFCMESTLYIFPPDGDFSPCDHGLDLNPSIVFGGGGGAVTVERCHHHGTPQEEESYRVRQRQGHLAGSTRRQDTAEDHRSSLRWVLQARGDPAGGTEWFPTEPFYHRCDVCDSPATGVGEEETHSAVCMLSRPYLSVRLRWPNPDLDSARPSWRATEYDLGHSSIPRWHASMRAARRQGVFGVIHCETGPSSRVHARAPPCSTSSSRWL